MLSRVVVVVMVVVVVLVVVVVVVVAVVVGTVGYLHATTSQRTSSFLLFHWNAWPLVQGYAPCRCGLIGSLFIHLFSHYSAPSRLIMATPPTSTPQPDSTLSDNVDLDPAAFLRNVRQLSEKREKHDSDKHRLEEEIEKSRQERAKRRAERSQSISPTKPTLRRERTEPVTTTATPGKTLQRPLEMDDVTKKPPGDNVPEFAGFGSLRRSKSTRARESSVETPGSAHSATSLARSGTLSWNRRPQSRGEPSRPVSAVSTSNNTPLTSRTSTEEPEKTREQIAASLSARDPSWFKQTADRGVGSAALRKSKDEQTTDTVASGRRAIPGWSRGASTDMDSGGSPTLPTSSHSATTSRTISARDSAFSSNRVSAARPSPTNNPDRNTLMAAEQEQEKTSPKAPPPHTRPMSMSSSQARIAHTGERSPSPTKGTGGFVQSAFLKRSESQSKRWSAHSTTSSHRHHNSVASLKAGPAALQGSQSMPKLEPTPSGHETPSRENPPGVRATPSAYSTSAQEGHASPPLPSSPGKRWSPTKSSWLESAIAQPEAPRAGPTARNAQPGWMANIAKARAQKAGSDGGARAVAAAAEDEGRSSQPASPAKEVFGQGILKRPGSRDLGTETWQRSCEASPTKAGFGSAGLKWAKAGGDGGPEVKSLAAALVPKAAETDPKRSSQDDRKSATVVEDSQRPAKTDSNSPVESTNTADSVKPRPNADPSPAQPPQSASTAKPQLPPHPPTDLRSTLRPRAPSSAPQSATPEFLSKFGRLRPAETKNYVAPDTLKDNILRGKSELAKTGGPVKTPRRDELKESLLAKKEQWRVEKESGLPRDRKGPAPSPPAPKPEALAKRDILHGRTGSAKTAAADPAPASQHQQQQTPEALARAKSLRHRAPSRPAATDPDAPAPPPAPRKQTSEPAPTTSATSTTSPPAAPAHAPWTKQTSTPAPGPAAGDPQEPSGLAARFNPHLAGLLARGPPASASASAPATRAEAPGMPGTLEPSADADDAARLLDVRKGRAKGPRRRRDGGGGGGAEGAGDAASAANPSTCIERRRDAARDGRNGARIACGAAGRSAPHQAPRAARIRGVGDAGFAGR